ncbi:MAG: hypothetical protein O2960_18400 [Verrucomicrobia bacterium]|nr:hypothetical protein [Verrucomicrobiota bacterium]
MQVSSANTSSLSRIPLALNLSPSQDRKVEAVERREEPQEEIAADDSSAFQSSDVDPAAEGKLEKLKMIQYAFGKALSINHLLEEEMIFEPVL